MEKKGIDKWEKPLLEKMSGGEFTDNFTYN